MKKRIFEAIFIGILLIGVTSMGYRAGMSSNIDDFTVYEGTSTDDLPVYESTSVYPEFTLSTLTDTASYILKAEVVEVGDSFLKEISASLTENPEDATEMISYPVTPVTLKVDNAVKGHMRDDEFTYYEEGGITSTYIQLPDGYAMEEGMEIILFLNQNGYGWGAQSIFPIIEDKVVLNETAWDYFDEKDMFVLDTQDLNSDYRNQINMEKVCLVAVDDFIGVIQDAMQAIK